VEQYLSLSAFIYHQETGDTKKMLLPEKLLVRFGRMKSPVQNLHIIICVLSLSVLIFTGRASADTTNQWNVQVVGVMVVAPEGGKDNRSFCWKPGTTVSASLTLSAGKIVKLNQEESKLVSFTDDKGTDLTAGPQSQDPFNKPGISFQSSEDGKAETIFDMKASGQPAKGATTLNISGTVNAQIAGATKQFTVENLEMKTNVSFTLGDLPVMISEVGTNRNAWMAKEYKYSVTFSSLRDMDCISSLEFFDAQGNKIESRKSSWGGGFMGYMMQFDLKQNVDHAKIVATCWQDLKTVDVPIAIKTGVGF
jgi:hypothetical protein